MNFSWKESSRQRLQLLVFLTLALFIAIISPFSFTKKLQVERAEAEKAAPQETLEKDFYSSGQFYSINDKFKEAKLTGMYDFAKVTPVWEKLLHQAREKGWRGHVKGPMSGVRTYKQQDYLYQLFLDGRGAPAFSPDGPSRHLETNVEYLGDWSMAVDVTHARELIYVAGELGVELHRPYEDEKWHVEAVTPFSL